MISKSTPRLLALGIAGLIWLAASPLWTLGQEPPAGEARTPEDGSLRSLLETYGLDDSAWKRLEDGRPWNTDEDEALLKVMFRLRQVEPIRMETWAAQGFPISRLPHDSDALRGQVFSIRGRMRRVEPIQPVPEIADRYELREYYRCELALASGHRAVVFAEHVPEAWRKSGSAEGRAGAIAVYLKYLGDAAEPMPAFVARRLAYFPETLLGELGMDVGLLENVVEQAPLGTADREAFYQMLAAVGRAAPGQLLAAAEEQLAAARRESTKDGQQPTAADIPPWVRVDEQGEWHYSVVPFFNKPAEQRGRLVAFSGVARQALKVLVEEEDLKQRFGLDHYYQIALFPEDSQGNPLMFCVRQLPPGLAASETGTIDQPMRIAGFFFKSWAYNVEIPRGMPDMEPGRRIQLAPLIIGLEPVLIAQPQPGAEPWIGVAVVGLIVLVIFAFWLAAWWQGRSDRVNRARLGQAPPQQPPAPFDDWQSTQEPRNINPFQTPE